MKAILILALVASLSACTSHTEYGECIGIADDANPKLQYSVSGWNIAMGILFFEFIAPPVVVLVSEIKCPVGVK